MSLLVVRGDVLKILRVLPVVALLMASAALAQTVPVVMLSDIHFDPFHDPGKVAKLNSAAASEWDAILNAPDTATQAADFAGLQRTCKAKGIDTPMPLLVSSLAAERAQMAKPLFVTVSGDLMAHQFDCKFRTLFPKSTEADYSAFAAKTVAFVALELHKTFPAAPIYFALGNNDSGCKDYAEDMNSAFLQGDGQSFAGDALNAANGAAIAKEFSQLGDYTVALPAPFEHTRLIVLQDIFESKRYANCDGTPDKTAAAKQIEWLRAELAAAAQKHEKVWVMAHIPPGIDAYSTFSKGNVCGGGDPTMFLGSAALGDALAEYAGTVKLGLFGHTHMDEMKLLHASAGMGVPVKLVPSITPVNGNNPSFTVAKVDPKTALLVDYSVYAASFALKDGQAGVGSVWSKEYTYSSTYGMPDYSAQSLEKLTSGFKSDVEGSAKDSVAYENFYFVGDPKISANAKAAGLRLVWHGYACSMTEMNGDDFRTCACPAKP